MMQFTSRATGSVSAAARTLDNAVEEFARATRFPVAFGGYESLGALEVTSLTGHRTMGLSGLQVEVGRGLGGRALSERRPRLTNDYGASSHITHDYDSQVLGEGILTLVAIPVVVDGTARAVLYGGTRGSIGPGEANLQAATAVATDLAKEIRLQDEVERRLAESVVENSARHPIPPSALEELRGVHAELRSLAAASGDPSVRARLEALETRVSGIAEPATRALPVVRGVATSHALSAAAGSPAGDVQLSPRETDVLAHAALGGTNVQIGAALGLAESTVKSYMKTAMSKLEASTRHAAVSAARMRGLIL